MIKAFEKCPLDCGQSVPSAQVVSMCKCKFRCLSSVRPPISGRVLCDPPLFMPSQVQQAQVILKSSEATHPAWRSDARLKKSCLSIPYAQVLRQCVKASWCPNSVIYCVHPLRAGDVLYVSIIENKALFFIGVSFFPNYDRSINLSIRI